VIKNKFRNFIKETMNFRILIPSPFDEFLDGFHCDQEYFSEHFYTENRDLIHNLLFNKFENELFARFPIRFDTSYIDLDISVYQRCLYRFSNLVIQKIKGYLYNMIFVENEYSSNLVFLYFRYLDTFAFLSKIPLIFINNEYFREILDFNNVSGHFFNVFRKQIKMRDLIPSLRLENKLDLRKDTIPYNVVSKSFSELEKLIFYVDRRVKCDRYFMQVILPEYKKFKVFMEKIYYFIIFSYQKMNELSIEQKNKYFKFLLEK
jgi:hypothetical protein